MIAIVWFVLMPVSLVLAGRGICELHQVLCELESENEW